MSEILVLSNIYKSFPKAKRYRELFTKPFRNDYINILEDINLEVNKGEIFGLVGPNGAGKTTLLKIIGTLILPTSGEAEVCGMELAKNSELIKKKVGYVLSSERSFYFRLSGRQNLEFFAMLNNVERNRLKSSVKKVLDLAGLSKFSELEYMKYSSGMQQKLAIARALLSDPEVLILDEPTKSLDPIYTDELHNLIKELSRRGKTILLASHNLNEVEELCDRVAILKNGKIIFTGQPKNIKSKFKFAGKGLELVK
jgi:ABC-2 type transport system ATP-binding protein